jgi:hypothetical protein
MLPVYANTQVTYLLFSILTKTNRNTYLIGRSLLTVKRVLAEEKNTGTLRPPKVFNNI